MHNEELEMKLKLTKKIQKQEIGSLKEINE